MDSSMGETSRWFHFLVQFLREIYETEKRRETDSAWLTQKRFVGAVQKSHKPQESEIADHVCIFQIAQAYSEQLLE